MIKRIKSLISVKNLTASQFADLLGVQRSNISHILSGRNKPSLDFILKITEHFPTVSIEWLLKGKGEMFNLEEKSIKSFPSQLDILIDNSDFDNEKDIEHSKEEGKFDDKNSEAENFKSTPDVFSKAAIEKVKNDDLASIVDSEEGIEQIMVLYKNGSFRVYTPSK